MKRNLIFILLLMISNLLLAQIPEGYYDGTAGLTGEDLKNALYDIIKGHSEYPYTSTSTDTWDILKLTDQDPENIENVILIYSGESVNAAQEWNSGNGWSREHIWAKSHGFPPLPGQDPAPGAGTDAHHLRPEDPTVNAAKGNKDFDNGGTVVASAPECYSTSNTWEPREEVKGDVARMIFYMEARYRGENGEPELQVVDYVPSIDPPVTGQQPFYGKLSTLLIWNLQDPPDDFEQNRNNVVYDFQGNRNPFVDHPEWINDIWNQSVQITFVSSPILSAISNELYTYEIKFAGLSENSLTISAEIIPNWLNLEQIDNKTATLSGTPTDENIGENNISLQLTDGISTIYQDFSVVVSIQGNNFLEQDFSNCPPQNWTTYSVSSNKNWTCASGYEEINGYSGDAASNDWLISPAINFNQYQFENLTFTSWTKYSDTEHPRLKIYYSSDYEMEENPENYNWEELNYSFPNANSETWTESGNIDLSEKDDENGFIAFQYTSSGTSGGSCSWWKIDDIVLSGLEINSPILNVNLTNLNFGEVLVGESSEEEIFTVEGQDLEENITITCPESFEISTTTNENFANSIILQHTDGVVEPTQIYVKFVPQNIQEYSGNIEISSLNATNKNISVSGIGIEELFYSVTFYVKNEEQEDVSEADITLNGATISTNVQGEAVFENLEAGTYNWQIEHSDYETLTGSIEIINLNESVDIELISNQNSIEENYENVINIFPNPSSGKYRIYIRNIDKKNTITVYNQIGKTVYSGDFSAHTTYLDLSDFENGVYILTISIEGKKYFKKIVKY